MIGTGAGRGACSLTASPELCFNRNLGPLAFSTGMSLELARLSFLDLVRGFVAVGRRMSITLAAQDLFLTQSAVSRQVHALEQQLGVKLLTRGHRSIALTAEGERLFRSADGAIQQLQDVLGELHARSRAKPVTVSATIGFTGLWLLPRLGRFQSQHPAVDVRVAAHSRIVDLRNEGIDLAIRYTTAERAPPGSRLLFNETIVPVASPALGLTSLRSDGTFSELTLLDFEDTRYPWIQWRPWLEANGRDGVRPRAVLHFNQYDLVIQAAVAGQGVALGRKELIRPLLEDGRLMALDTSFSGPESKYGYWLIQAEAEPRREVAEVAEWIGNEALLQSTA